MWKVPRRSVNFLFLFVCACACVCVCVFVCACCMCVCVCVCVCACVCMCVFLGVCVCVCVCVCKGWLISSWPKVHVIGVCFRKSHWGFYSTSSPLFRSCHCVHPYIITIITKTFPSFICPKRIEALHLTVGILFFSVLQKTHAFRTRLSSVYWVKQVADKGNHNMASYAGKGSM